MYICSIKLLTKEPEKVCSECLSKQFRFSLRIYATCNSRGIAGTLTFLPADSFWTNKTSGILPCTAAMTQNQSPGTAGTTQRPHARSSPAVLSPPPWAVVPLFPCLQTPFDGLHIRDLLFFFYFFFLSFCDLQLC